MPFLSTPVLTLLSGPVPVPALPETPTHAAYIKLTFLAYICLVASPNYSLETHNAIRYLTEHMWQKIDSLGTCSSI